MLLTNRCPKCKGALVFDRDRYGVYVQCLNCGLLRDVLTPAAQKPVAVTLVGVKTVGGNSGEEHFQIIPAKSDLVEKK